MTQHTLLLLRHAKSSWDDPSLADFDRPLAKRGLEAAPRTGRELARRGWVPQMAIVSPALRTRQTWELVSAELPAQSDVVFDPAIYEAKSQHILASIRQTPEWVATLIVVGHNPGMEQLADALAGPGSEPDTLSRMTAKYPTCGLAVFRLGAPWKTLDEQGAELATFVTPKDLG